MFSLKSTALIFLLIISVCFAQDGQEMARKRYKHKLHHLHHNPYFYYLAFLAIKLKFAFVIGTMILVALFASKTYALLKYGILTQKSKEPEKVYIQAPAAEHYPSYFSADHDIHDHDHEYAASESPSYGYGRALQTDLYENLNLVRDLAQKFELNEMVFNSMDIRDTECKQRFVCEAEMQAKNDTILSIGMYLIRDNTFVKYKTHELIQSIEDCAKLCSSKT